MKLAVIGLGMLIMGTLSTPEEHLKEVEDWHAWRIDRLHSPTGWLSLVGLVRLQEGENSVGSGEDAMVRLPESAPAHVGTIVLADGVARLEGAAGAVTIEGEPVGDSVPLHPDVSDTGEATTICQVGSVQFFLIQRQGHLLVRIKDSEAPLLKRFDGEIERWPVDEKWRIVANWIEYDPPKELTVANEIGFTEVETLKGYVEFEFEGETYTLDPLVVGDEYFFIIADETSGVESYGGMRYFYTPMQDENDEVVLDFNKAYNPPCAFTAYGTCTLAPKGNRLPFRVTAGEKMWKGEPAGAGH